LKEISLLRQVLNKINIIEKNKLDLDEKKEIENDRNIIWLNENKTINLIYPKIKENFKQACEKCGHKNNVLIFNSFQSILEYSVDKLYKFLI